MIKIVVFDSGYGGEMVADLLEEELPIAEIIRVIDWRNADKILASSRSARHTAEKALEKYIGKVDLIIFANHLLSATSLKYFRRKYKNQKFLGLRLVQPTTFIKRNSIILTTKALTKSLDYHKYMMQHRHNAKTLCLDDWVELIDDGELTRDEIRSTIEKYIANETPEEIVLACSQFSDIKNDLRYIFGNNVRINDSFRDVITDVCKILRIRGGAYRKQR